MPFVSGGFEEEDEWYGHNWHRGTGRPVGGRYVSDYRSSNDFLSPMNGFSASGLHRSRSHGHSPAPNVYVYTTANSKNENERSPSPNPRGRPSLRADDYDIYDNIRELRRDIRELSRQRSRGRSDAPAHPAWREPSPNYMDWQLQQARERLSDQERRAQWEKEEQLLKKKLELKALKEKLERDEEEDRSQKKYEAQKLKDAAKARDDVAAAEALKQKILAEKEQADREAKAAQQRAVEEWQRKKDEEAKEAKALREKILLEEEKKKQDAKKELEEMKLKIKLEEEAEKIREQEEHEKWLRKQKDKEDKEKAEKKAKDEALAAEMHKRLAQFGFQENQIQAMVDPSKAQALPAGASPAKPLTYQTPTYIKIHRDHLDMETLKYFRIPWEYDASNTDYIIILQEMSTRETDVLFEHTRRLRRRTGFLIEDRGRNKKPEYAWVRRKHHSKSPAGRRRSSTKRVSVLGSLY